jgi:hypothetical protein
MATTVKRRATSFRLPMDLLEKLENKWRVLGGLEGVVVGV